MDIPRTSSAARKRRFRKIIYVAVALGLLLAVTLAAARLKPAAPSVDRSTLWVDTVKRGEMLRQVRGPGTLTPQEVRVIAASSEGRVERVLVQAGTPVSADTVLIELSNPTLQQEAQDAEYQVRVAEADLSNLRVKLKSERMSQASVVASVYADYKQAAIQSDADEQLAKDGLVAPINLKLSQVKREELAGRHRIEQQRLDISDKATQAQLAAQQARIAQLQALRKLKQEQVRSLQVVAGTNGVLQQMQIEVGQQITLGTNLARVVEPQRLKAELKIAETQAKDVQLNQQVAVDTRNGVIPGHVIRIDPAVEQGTVTVDVALDGPLPQGARPDLSVDGTIELERLDDVIYVGRPAFGQTENTVGLFVLEPGGGAATRVQVKLGRSSVNSIEVLEGLKPGDQVILSDTSAWDNYNRILLQ